MSLVEELVKSKTEFEESRSSRNAAMEYFGEVTNINNSLIGKLDAAKKNQAGNAQELAKSEAKATTIIEAMKAKSMELKKQEKDFRCTAERKLVSNIEMKKELEEINARNEEMVKLLTGLSLAMEGCEEFLVRAN